jgi:hypothetical protein
MFEICKKKRLPCRVPLSKYTSSIEHHMTSVCPQDIWICMVSRAKLGSWICSVFLWLISHQSAVLFSQNKSAASNQPTVLSLRTNQHQPSATSQTNRLLLASRAGELAMGGRALPRRRDEFLRACAAGTDLGINLGTFLLHLVSHSLIVLPQIRRRDCGGWIRPRLAEWTITVEMGSQKRLCLFDRSY